MRVSRSQAVAAVLTAVACLLGVARGASVSVPEPAAAVMGPVEVEPAVTVTDTGSWGTLSGLARCAVTGQPLDCLETRSQRAVNALLAPGGRAAAGDAALEPEVVGQVGELSEILVDAAAKFLERRTGLVSEEQSRDLQDEGRGHKKKKKIHKLIALVKLVLLVLVVKLKLAFIMMALQTLFQFKLVVMVFLILLCKKISLWAQLKNKHTEQPNKVIYYEHAQHQHHYEEPHGWGGHEEHHDEHSGGGGGGWGGLWGRSYDTLPANTGATSTTSVVGDPQQTVGVQSGVYRAADGTRIVIRPSDAHDMAYSAQRPSPSALV